MQVQVLSAAVFLFGAGERVRTCVVESLIRTRSDMERLAWTMDVIEAGPLQICITAVLVVAGVVLGRLFGRSRFRKENVLLVTGLILIASEILKESFLYYLQGSYSWSDFPFQLCSIPMYFCVLYYFLHRRWIEQFIMVFAIIGGGASFLVPAAIFSQYVLLTVHSLFWHVALLFLGSFLICRQTPASVRLLHFVPVGLAYVLLAAAAIALNSCFYNVSHGTMNMFFLGPGWPDMVVLNDIYTGSGWIAASLGMIGVTLGSGFGVYLLVWFGTRQLAARRQ